MRNWASFTGSLDIQCESIELLLEIEPEGHVLLNIATIVDVDLVSRVGIKCEIVRAALNDLPREQIEAIELAFFRGLTQTEISDLLQVPLGTIKARIRRGMLQMRTILEGKE